MVTLKGQVNILSFSNPADLSEMKHSQANVLVDEQGKCYLADFGLATTAFTATLMQSTTTGNVGKGTMRWMAPELFHSELEDEDEATNSMNRATIKPLKSNDIKFSRDIYAYACTVYEVCYFSPSTEPFQTSSNSD